jgi:HEPN domain-containing protein
LIRLSNTGLKARNMISIRERVYCKLSAFLTPFSCAHLALEKVLKAVFVKAAQEHAPFTHSLPLLASKANIEIPEPMLDRFAEYMEFHIEARYPDDKKDFYKKCTEEFALSKFSEMEEDYQWLIRKLEI